MTCYISADTFPHLTPVLLLDPDPFYHKFYEYGSVKMDTDPWKRTWGREADFIELMKVPSN